MDRMTDSSHAPENRHCRSIASAYSYHMSCQKRMQLAPARFRRVSSIEGIPYTDPLRTPGRCS
jgi:hypothetical protein